MSNSLVSLNTVTNLVRNFGIKSKEGMHYSQDGECIFLPGIFEVISYEEIEKPSSSGRSVKSVKLPKEIRIIPARDINLNLVSKVNMCRSFVSVNPKLLEMAKSIIYPQILEPLTDDNIFVSMQCKEGITLEALESLDHFVRLYVLS